MIVTLALWAAAALLALLAVSGLAQMARASGWREAALWDAPLAFTAAALAALADLGVFPPLGGAVLAVTPLLAAAATAVPGWRELAAADGKARATWRVLRGFGAHVRDSALNSSDDLRGLLRRDRPAADAAPAPVPQAPAGAPSAPRGVPPLRDDPALGPLPDPGAVAAGLAEAGAEVPPPWAELAAWVAGFEPESSAHQSWFIRGTAAGLIAVGEAYHAHGDNVVHGAGLDPAYGSAVLDLGDAVAGASGHAAHTDGRFHVIYGEIVKAVENGLILPHRAREFFSGSGESAA